MKDDFYIFLDIDGTLWDFQSLPVEELFLFDKSTYSVKPNLYNDFASLKPSSVDALNYLISTLEPKFNVIVVVTSNKRSNMEKVKQYLKGEFKNFYFNSYDFSPVKSSLFLNDSQIDSTQIDDFSRGEQIADYLAERGVKDFEFNIFTKMMPNRRRFSFSNFVIIDDDTKSIKPMFLHDRIIETNKINNALSKKHVDKFFEKNPELLQKQPQ